MKVLTDENLPASLASMLRGVSIDAVDVRERRIAGASDDQVLALASSEGRILVSMDVRRFGNLIATSPDQTPGLIVVRMPGISSTGVSQRVVDFLRTTDEGSLRGVLTILETTSVRRRR
jgi:predicted nuclease of predicted toxin-antitoxin system